MIHYKLKYGDIVRAIYGNTIDKEDTYLNCWEYAENCPDVLIKYPPIIKMNALRSPLLINIFGE